MDERFNGEPFSLPIGKLKRKKDWVGLVVESKHKIQNGYMVARAGTRFFVERSYNGLHLLSQECLECGLSMRVTRVAENSVTVIGRLREPPADKRSIRY